MMKSGFMVMWKRIKSLLGEMFKFAKDDNKRTIKLYVYFDNIGLIELYEQYGFK